MVETQTVVEAQIVAKEIELPWEYKIHQGRTLAANPFSKVCILLARGMLEKAQIEHGIMEALTLIR